MDSNDVSLAAEFKEGQKDLRPWWIDPQNPASIHPQVKKDLSSCSLGLKTLLAMRRVLNSGPK